MPTEIATCFADPATKQTTKDNCDQPTVTCSSPSVEKTPTKDCETGQMQDLLEKLQAEHRSLSKQKPICPPLPSVFSILIPNRPEIVVAGDKCEVKEGILMIFNGPKVTSIWTLSNIEGVKMGKVRGN